MSWVEGLGKAVKKRTSGHSKGDEGKRAARGGGKMGRRLGIWGKKGQ